MLRELSAARSLPEAAAAVVRDAVARLGCAWAAAYAPGPDGAPQFASAGLDGGPRELPSALLEVPRREAPFPLQEGVVPGGSAEWRAACPHLWCGTAGPDGVVVVASALAPDRDALAELGGIARLAFSRAGALDAARARTDLLERLLAHVPALVLLTRGPEHVVEAANESFATRLAYGGSRLVGCRMRDALPTLAAQGFLPLCDRVFRSGQRFVTPELSVLPSGATASEEHWYNIVFEPMTDLAGRTDGLLLFCVDVTEQVRARRALEVAEQERTRIQARLAQGQKLEAVGRLAGGVAHDFNNILAVAKGNLELASHQAPPYSRLAERIDAAMTALERATELTRQLGSIGGRAAFERDASDLTAIVAELHALMRAAVPSRVAVTLDLPLTPLPVRGGWSALQQLVLNLTLNAIESIEGTGRVVIGAVVREVGDDEVSEACGSEGFAPGRYTVLTVSDTGCGMDATLRARVYDPYFTTKPSGSGLGLANVIGTLRALGGAVRVRSAPGEGSEFDVYLPLASPEELARGGPLRGPVSTPPRDVPVRPPGGGGPGLLVVEDDADIRELIDVAVEHLGVPVHHAGTLADAQALLSDPGIRVAAILLDLHLPDGEGKAAYDAVRAAAPTATIVLCTGINPAAAVQLVRGGPEQRVLAKPFDIPSLLRVVSSALTDGGARPPGGSGR